MFTVCCLVGVAGWFMIRFDRAAQHRQRNQENIFYSNFYHVYIHLGCADQRIFSSIAKRMQLLQPLNATDNISRNDKRMLRSFLDQNFIAIPKILLRNFQGVLRTVPLVI